MPLIERGRAPTKNNHLPEHRDATKPRPKTWKISRKADSAPSPFSYVGQGAKAQRNKTTSGLSGRSKSLVVLVPLDAIREHKSQSHAIKEEDEAIARRLADPVASYVFTHRSTFGTFRVVYSFAKTPPPEIEQEPPELTRGDLKAWLV